ncbi:hypothetical protein C8F04DRAFT_1181261 [Mycena alexandri]|uniref:Uncharacterized protein n=1 Tax=Mycena alexandri TaxID=1745969 RepID=A0AAD6SYU6_9AGAR|nr:hypothetical protein C8F04DRAFT_1181261 [Mycena alexandri]
MQGKSSPLSRARAARVMLKRRTVTGLVLVSANMGNHAFLSGECVLGCQLATEAEAAATPPARETDMALDRNFKPTRCPSSRHLEEIVAVVTYNLERRGALILKSTAGNRLRLPVNTDLVELDFGWILAGFPLAHAGS